MEKAIRQIQVLNSGHESAKLHTSRAQSQNRQDLCLSAQGTGAQAASHSRSPSFSGHQEGCLLSLLPLGNKDVSNHEMSGSRLRTSGPGLHTLSRGVRSAWW